MKAFSIWNPKGGVGKTTITLHLAAYFASVGQRVLIVNLDRQQSSSVYADRSMVDVVDGMPKSQPDADIVIFDDNILKELKSLKSWQRTSYYGLLSSLGYFLLCWFALFLQMHSFYVLPISWKVLTIVNN